MFWIGAIIQNRWIESIANYQNRKQFIYSVKNDDKNGNSRSIVCDDQITCLYSKWFPPCLLIVWELIVIISFLILLITILKYDYNHLLLVNAFNLFYDVLYFNFLRILNMICSITALTSMFSFTVSHNKALFHYCYHSCQ